jgi:LmbE family N-acetylglucosaminyl deacetylase
MDPLAPLLGKTLILVAHPDDEVIAFAGLMQRMRHAALVIATDGAPRDSSFWREYGSRERYVEVRRQEAQRVAAMVGGQPIFLSHRVQDGIVDQELFRRLPQAIPALEDVIRATSPDALLTLAYEGGHPDHDACSFMGWWLSRNGKIPAWESPLYHRHSDGSGAVQTFPYLTGLEIQYNLEAEALQKKVEMLHCYKSQRLVLEEFCPDVERFRPLADYDFTRPPLPWKLNYELWQWPMTGEEVSRCFASYLSGEGTCNGNEHAQP